MKRPDTRNYGKGTQRFDPRYENGGFVGMAPHQAVQQPTYQIQQPGANERMRRQMDRERARESSNVEDRRGETYSDADRMEDQRFEKYVSLRADPLPADARADTGPSEEDMAALPYDEE